MVKTTVADKLETPARPLAAMPPTYYHVNLHIFFFVNPFFSPELKDSEKITVANCLQSGRNL